MFAAAPSAAVGPGVARYVTTSGDPPSTTEPRPLKVSVWPVTVTWLASSRVPLTVALFAS